MSYIHLYPIVLVKNKSVNPFEMVTFKMEACDMLFVMGRLGLVCFCDGLADISIMNYVGVDPLCSDLPKVDRCLCVALFLKVILNRHCSRLLLCLKCAMDRQSLSVSISKALTERKSVNSYVDRVVCL